MLRLEAVRTRIKNDMEPCKPFSILPTCISFVLAYFYLFGRISIVCDWNVGMVLLYCKRFAWAREWEAGRPIE